MVAAGVQTNGYVGARRLTKSFSEVGGDRLANRDNQSDITTTVERFIDVILYIIHLLNFLM